MDKTAIKFEITVAEAEVLINKLGELPGKQCFTEMAFLHGKASEAIDKANKEANAN